MHACMHVYRFVLHVCRFVLFFFLFFFFLQEYLQIYVIRALKISHFLCRTDLNGAIVPADSAQPLMKETINSIQTKLDHLYNRTQVNRVKVKASEMPFF